MELRSGRRVLAPLLLIALAVSASAAAVPSYEDVWRQAVADSERMDVRLVAARVDEALARAGNSDERWVWALRILRAQLHVQMQEFEKAERILSRKLPPELRRTGLESRRLTSLAMLRWFSGDPEALEQALKHAQKYAHEELPDIYLARANFTKSEADFREALRQAKMTKDPNRVLRVRAAAVMFHARRGQFDEAIQAGEDVLPLLQARGLRRSAKTVTGNLGWAYFEIGNYDRAEELFLRGDAEAARMNQLSERLFWVDWLGNVHFVRRDWAAAEAAYRNVLGAVREGGQHRETVHVFAYLARVCAETGRYDEGRRYAKEALAIAQKRREQETDAQKRREIEEIALNVRVIVAWLDTLARRYAGVEKELLHILGATKAPAVRSAARIRLAQLYVRTGRHDDADRYFRAAIQSAREARDDLKNPERQMSFFNTIDETFDDYVDFLVRREEAGKALAVAETSRALTLEEGLGIPAASPDLDPRAVVKRAGVAAALSYWLGRHRSYVWTVTRNAVTVHPLPSDTIIEREVERYLKDLQGARGTLRVSGARGGTSLFSMLVPPAAQKLTGGAYVVIVPDGRLHALSFETLVRNRRYWIHDVTLVNAPSLRLLARNAQRPARTGTMLLVGNPLAADPLYPPLKHAQEELNGIERQFGRSCTLLGGARATPTAYRAAAPEKFDFVHFVAHGMPTQKRPLDTAVILGRDAKQSYKLLASEIADQRLRARLVTISSCHGAGTRAYAGEGLVGLAWAFLRAGADQAVAALWQVDDATTPRLMSGMYEEILAGRDPAAALRAAKLRLLQTEGVTKNPKYWAPFVLYSGS